MALTPSQLAGIRREARATGNGLKAARRLLDMTQDEMAPKLGLTQSALSDYERQRYSDMSLETARKFAQFFGCAIEDLFPSKAA